VVRYRPLLVAGAGGVFLALASPPTDFYPGIIASYALLALAIDAAPNARRAFGRAVFWGTVAQVIGLRFVPEVIVRFTPLPLPAGLLALFLLSAAQSITWGLGMTAAWFFAKRLRAPLELAFAAGVFLALALPTIFAWSPAGILTPWPMMVQLADVVGERGVSALLAVSAALLARATLAAFGLRPGDAWPDRLRVADAPAAARPALASIGLLAALAGYGVLRIHQVSAARASLPTVKIGLVDQAVMPLDRWNPKKFAGILRALRSLTEGAERDGAELTIWPEAAYPYPLEHDAPHIEGKGRAILGDGVGGPVLFGLITRSGADENGDRDDFNSASIVAKDGSISAPADKLELLWFGETVPGSAWFPWLRHVFQRSGALAPGEAPRALVLPRDDGRPALTMAVMNCYEDTLTGVGRRVTKSLAPNLLVNVTNDAWFYDTAESELHARLGAMRAIETRHDLVRAVNFGVMTWVDATGTVRARWGEPRAHQMIVTPAVDDGSLTVFTRFGDAPAVLLMTALAVWFWRRPRPKDAT
jgi:apolipoprotein N-acyltransferase